jgi:serine protease AprX
MIAFVRFSLLLCLPLVLVSATFGGTKSSSRLAPALKIVAPGDRLAVWVYFVDKGPSSLDRGSISPPLVTERALRRRMRRGSPASLVDASDLPVAPQYLEQVERHGPKIRQISKWLNAVSVDATREEIAGLDTLTFVRAIDLVNRFGRRGTRDSLERSSTPGPISAGRVDGAHSLNYGGSLAQVGLENIPAVHDAGFAGQGVLIGIFDDGFRLLAHTSFDSLRSRIVAQYDFVDNRVGAAPLDPNLGEHGVNTLSVLAGFAPGTLIGPAYRASFLLARTEDTRSETPVEEDNWVRAIEWAESLGVEVSSTSLGYIDFDPPYQSLTWSDLDGKTAPITRAAVMAARKGIVVVNSAGNEALVYPSEPNSLFAPADADSILAVGAVTSSGVRAASSSFGPTADGRIKPDVMAVGTSIHAAVGSGVNSYTTSVQGTSFSCPLTAGVAAMVLSARPDASAMQVVGAIKATASRSSHPDNYYGWGIVNALAAILSIPDGSNPPPVPGEIGLEQNFPNPFNPSTRIRFSLSTDARVTIRVYDLLGREVATLVDGDYVVTLGPPYETMWNGIDVKGNPVSTGVYFYRMTATSGPVTLTQVRKMMLVR